VSGEHVELDSDPGGSKKAERTLNNKLGTSTSTVWFSAIVDGSGASEIHNVSLGDGLIVGQGTKATGSTTWMLSDQDGLIQDTGQSSDGRAFLVVRIDVITFSWGIFHGCTYQAKESAAFPRWSSPYCWRSSMQHSTRSSGAARATPTEHSATRVDDLRDRGHYRRSLD
jgi:hypothetical protein